MNIRIKGTGDGTISDLNGQYFLEVPNKQAILEFSYVGYETQEIVVGNQININVNLKEESNSLDEVVVVGYGNQKRCRL